MPVIVWGLSNRKGKLLLILLALMLRPVRSSGGDRQTHPRPRPRRHLTAPPSTYTAGRDARSSSRRLRSREDALSLGGHRCRAVGGVRPVDMTWQK